MGILISRNGARKLTDIFEIREAYAKYSQAQSAYWDDLNEKVVLICKGFTKHLGLEEKYFSLNGVKTPYVQLGTYEDGHFEAVRVADFEGDNLSIPFALKVTLDADQESISKEHYVIELSIQKKDGMYAVIVQQDAGVAKASIPASFSEKRQSELYECMASQIIDYLNPAVFG